MLSDLIVNIAILTSFTFIWHHLFRKHRLTLSSPIKIKILDGLIGGLLGVALMHYSIVINEMTILDLRHIPIILLAYFGGILPPLVAAAVITVGRFFIDINFSSTVSFFMVFVMAIGAGLITKHWKVAGLKKWTVLLAYSQLIFTLALFIVVDRFSLIMHVAFYHIVSSLVGGFLTYYFVSFIRRYTELYFTYKENSQRDSLTGLYNVRSFDYFYNLMLAKAKEEAGSFAICLIDVDYFKKINDTYGHTAGDEVLKQLATLLCKLMRDNDIIARNGGEEFSILLENCNTVHAEEIAGRIRNAVEQYEFVLLDKKKINITVSIGIATYNSELNNHDNLYEVADHALYKAKQLGRNHVSTYS